MHHLHAFIYVFIYDVHKWHPIFQCCFVYYKCCFVLHTAIVCRALPAITYGSITYAPETTPDYDLGTVATYTCDAGFVLDLSLGGSVMRTCVDDMDNVAIGEFDRQEPRCIRK